MYEWIFLKFDSRIFFGFLYFGGLENSLGLF